MKLALLLLLLFAVPAQAADLGEFSFDEIKAMATLCNRSRQPDPCTPVGVLPHRATKDKPMCAEDYEPTFAAGKEDCLDAWRELNRRLIPLKADLAARARERAAQAATQKTNEQLWLDGMLGK